MEEVVKFLGGSALLLGAAAWLIRSLTKHLLDKDVELFRERIRAQVAISSRLHEERGNVIRELYTNLVDLIEKTASFVHPAEMSGEPTKDEKQKLVRQALESFLTHFSRNRIYLSASLSERIQEFVDSFVDPASKFALYRTMSKDETSGSVAKEMHTAWFEAFDVVQKQIPAMRIALEEEFRLVLGTATIESNV